MLTLYQPCINVVQRCFDVVLMSGDVVSTSGIDVVSTLYNIENPTSNFVSFSTLDQLKQRWTDAELFAEYRTCRKPCCKKC